MAGPEPDDRGNAEPRPDRRPEPAPEPNDEGDADRPPGLGALDEHGENAPEPNEPA